MPKPLPITDEIQQIKARLRELQNQQLEELRTRRRELADELARVERQIADDITGAPVQASVPADGQAPRKRAPKIPKLVKDSEEYKEIARNVQTILAKEPTGLNGKQVADTLRGLEHDADALAVDERALKTAQDALNLVQANYRAGLTTYSDLLIADTLYSEARIADIQAKAVRYQDTVALFVALGGGWWNKPDKVAANLTP